MSMKRASASSIGASTLAAASTRVINRRAPSPTIATTASTVSGGAPYWLSSSFAESAMSRRESIRVPSRSKAMSRIMSGV